MSGGSPVLYTKMLKRKVRLLCRHPDSGRVGHVVNVYLPAEGDEVFYTVMLKDGRLIEAHGTEIVVEG